MRDQATAQRTIVAWTPAQSDTLLQLQHELQCPQHRRPPDSLTIAPEKLPLSEQLEFRPSSRVRPPARNNTRDSTGPRPPANSRTSAGPLARLRANSHASTGPLAHASPNASAIPRAHAIADTRAGGHNTRICPQCCISPSARAKNTHSPPHTKPNSPHRLLRRPTIWPRDPTNGDGNVGPRRTQRTRCHLTHRRLAHSAMLIERSP